MTNGKGEIMKYKRYYFGVGFEDGKCLFYEKRDIKEVLWVAQNDWDFYVCDIKKKVAFVCAVIAKVEEDKTGNKKTKVLKILWSNKAIHKSQIAKGTFIDDF